MTGSVSRLSVADLKSELQDLEKNGDFDTSNLENGAGMIQPDISPPKTRKEKLKKLAKQNLHSILTFAGVVIGICLGIGLAVGPDKKWTDREVMYVGFVGELFLNMLKALIIPLIVSSLVSAIGSLDLSLSKKIGGWAVCYYLCTTLSAICLGILLVMTIKPGEKGSVTANGDEETEQRNVTTADSLMDLLRMCFPPNLVQATMYVYRTSVLYPTNLNASDEVPPMDEWKVSYQWDQSTNILGLVVFCVALGIAIGKLGEPARPLLHFFQALSACSMQITSWVIWLSPIGIISLIAQQLVAQEDFSGFLGSVGMYFVTVIVGIFIHGCLVLPGIYFIITRKNPYSYLSRMSPAMLTAFGTGSSSACLPVTMECVAKNGVDKRVSNFVLPIGSTINMDGTALYEAVGAIFIAQTQGMELSAANVIVISLTATAAAVGAAGIPQAGLVTMVMVLDVIGLPSEYVSIILAVDWLLDRFRTALNVEGDAIGAGLVNTLCQKDLAEIDRKSAERKDLEMRLSLATTMDIGDVSEKEYRNP